MATNQNRFLGCFFTIASLTIILSAATVQSDTTRKPVPESGNASQQQPTHWISIQVGAFPQLSLAEKAVSDLREKGYDPFYHYEDTGTRGMWYRVYIGRYPTRIEARDAARQLIQQEVIDDYMIRKLLPEPEFPDPEATREGEQPPSVSERGERTRDSRFTEIGQEDRTANEENTSASSVELVNTSLYAATAKSADQPAGSVSGSPMVRLSLGDAIRYSLEGNREISVVSYEPQQAQAKIEGTESAYDPLLFADTTFSREPNLESSVTDIVTEDERRTRAGIRKPLKTGGSLSAYLESRYGDLNNSGIQRTYKNIFAPTIELQQPLLNNIGSKKEKAAIQIANLQAKVSDAELHRKVIEIANDVSAVYWKLYLFREIMDINRKNLEMAEEVHRREAERHTRGISQQLDVERAHSNAQTRRSTWLRSREEYLLTMDRLKLLLNWRSLNIDSDVEVLPTETPRTSAVAPDQKEIIETALTHRPEVRKAMEEMTIRQVDQALAAHQRLPKLDAFGRYSISGYGDDFSDAWDDVSVSEEDAWEVGLQFEWPLGNRLAKSRYRQKALGHSQAQEQLERVKDDVKLEVKQVLKRLATVTGEIQANRLAKAAAEKVVEGEFTRFDIGQTTNEELLRAQDLLAVTSRSLVRAIVDYNITLHDLSRVQGILPDGIEIE